MAIIFENKTSPVYFEPQPILSKIPHFHKHIEIIYVKSGSSDAIVDERHYSLQQGDLFISFPNQVHYYESCVIGEYYVMIFSPDSILEIGNIILNSIPKNNVINISGIIPIKDIIRKISKVQGKYGNLELNGYFNILMSYLLPELTLRTIDIENDSSLRNIISFCSENFREDITLDLISENLHLSKYYISHLINSRLNTNLNEYINNLRINAACTILKTTDKKIADISEDVGFGTIRSFNRSFLQIMQCTPAEYRKNALKLVN